ncbi:MAG TPA: LLM class flavin-dependent oxidoreductase, partial [Acidimicrobiia bacterium]|nr:LLM class flavin-dependent oxidoreductase [Acidimicrobiia bacterium]
HRSLLLRYLDTFPRPAGIPEWPALLPDPTPEQIDDSIRAGDTAYGTPEEVEVAIAKYADAGVDQVVFGLLSSSMERELAVETIETFGKHVLPVFDKDRVHRTTQQREAAASTSPPS